MESLSVSKVFGVPEDYTLEQLKKSYIDLMENLFKSNKTEIEKDLLASQYKQLYHQGKQIYLNKESMKTDIEYSPYLFDKTFDNSLSFGQRIRRIYNPLSMCDNIFNQLNNNFSNSYSNSNVYSYSSSYSSNTNSDGSRTIIKQKTESTNGDKKKTINAFKKMPDGSIVNFTEDEMKQLEKMSNLQIKN